MKITVIWISNNLCITTRKLVFQGENIQIDNVFFLPQIRQLPFFVISFGKSGASEWVLILLHLFFIGNQLPLGPCQFKKGTEKLLVLKKSKFLMKMHLLEREYNIFFWNKFSSVWSELFARCRGTRSAPHPRLPADTSSGPGKNPRLPAAQSSGLGKNPRLPAHQSSEPGKNQGTRLGCLLIRAQDQVKIREHDLPRTLGCLLIRAQDQVKIREPDLPWTLGCLLIRAQDQVKISLGDWTVADQSTGSNKISGLDSGLSADRSSVPGR